jgi:hypothetical protein
MLLLLLVDVIGMKRVMGQGGLGEKIIRELQLMNTEYFETVSVFAYIVMLKLNSGLHHWVLVKMLLLSLNLPLIKGNKNIFNHPIYNNKLFRRINFCVTLD